VHSGNDVHFTEMYGKNEENIKKFKKVLDLFLMM